MGTPTSRVPLQDSFFQRIVKNREGLCVVGDKERRAIRFLTQFVTHIHIHIHTHYFLLSNILVYSGSGTIQYE